MLAHLQDKINMKSTHTKPTFFSDLKISNMTSQGGHRLRIPKCHFDLALYCRFDGGFEVESWRLTGGFL
jgi:hypothetical protein